MPNHSVCFDAFCARLGQTTYFYYSEIRRRPPVISARTPRYGRLPGGRRLPLVTYHGPAPVTMTPAPAAAPPQKE
jgi:hypothetical protein